MWYDEIIAAHTAVTSSVSHGGRIKSNRYFVWQEDDRADLSADDSHSETATTGTTDLYTPNEFDCWASALEKSFDERGICWRRSSVQYEDETGLWHIEWEWAVYG